MMRLNHLAACLAVCSGFFAGAAIAATEQKMNNRVSLALSDQGQLVVKSSYLTYYMLRGRDPVSQQMANPIFIKPVDGRLDGPALSVDWVGSDTWYPSVDTKLPQFKSAEQKIDLTTLRYQGAARDWQNTDVLLTGASLQDLFADPNFAQGDRVATTTLVGLNSLRLVGIAGATIAKAANLDTDKSLPKIQKLAEQFRDAKAVVNGLTTYVAYAQVSLDYIQSLQKTMGSDAAALDPYIQSFKLLKDNMDFFTQNIEDKQELINTKKQIKDVFLENFSKSMGDRPDVPPDANYEQVIAAVQKDFAKKYKAATPADQEILLTQMTLEYFGSLLGLVDDGLTDKIKAETDSTKKDSLLKQQTWLRRGKGAVNLLVLYTSHKELVDKIINDPVTLTPMFAEIGQMFVTELEERLDFKKMVKGQIQLLQDTTIKAAKKAADKTPYMKALKLGTQAGNVLIPFLWDAVLAESRLNTSITKGRFDPMGPLKSTVYVIRTNAKTGEKTTHIYRHDALTGQPMSLVANAGDQIETRVAVQRPLMFSSERAPWLLNFSAAPSRLYEVSTYYANSAAPTATVQTWLCARKLSGNLDYSVYEVSAQNVNAVFNAPAVCGAGELLGNGWFKDEPFRINNVFTKVSLYNDPDQMPATYRLGAEMSVDNDVQRHSRTVLNTDQQVLVQVSTAGSDTMHVYQLNIVPERTIKVEPSKTEVSLGETISIKVDAVWDGVKTLLVTVGDKVIEIFSDFGQAINYLFEQLGEQTIRAEILNDDNQRLGVDTASVNVKAIALGSVTPSQVIRTQAQQFSFTGERLPANMRVATTGGECGSPMDVTSTRFTLNCDFDLIGAQTITVFNTANNQVVGSATVQVKSNVTAVKWGDNNGTVRFGDTVTYAVEGVNLTGGMGFAVEKCGVSNTEIGVGTSTTRAFECFFNPEDGATAGQMKGVVKDKPNGQVLFEFSVPVEVAATATGGGLLPATGITNCGNDTTNGLLCTPEALGALYGLGQDGEVQAGQKMSYTVLNQSGADCVKDNVTGLMWEQKTDDGGLRDKDWTYTWYNPNSATNGGNAGTANGGSCGGTSGCDTQAYVAALNAANYCGYSDWRMPSRMELTNLVDFSKPYPGPMIHPVFANTLGGVYWSASPFASDEHTFYGAWGAHFFNGVSLGNFKNGSALIRAVRTGHEQR